ncbi:unnamed protein product [Gemmataceae bacterium]|nr:unnamed protein product [Gemmataceae bacterium]VTT98870.1 unnamed protein product [Gemmataceae bacterium]
MSEPLLTEPLAYPDQATVDLWNVREKGTRDGSSPSESLLVDASSATRVFEVDWENRHQFVKLMLGDVALWDDGGTTKLSRLLPRKHPVLTDLIATRAPRITGHKWVANEIPGLDDEYEFDVAGTQMNVFEKAIVEIQYEHAPFTRLEDDEVAESEVERFVSLDDTQPSAEFLQLPGAVLAYIRETGTDPPHNLAIPFNTAIVVPQEVRRVTWHDIPEEVWVPGSALWDRVYGAEGAPSYLGSINSVEFLGFPTGTLLFSAVQPRRLKSPTGVGFRWSLTYEFTFRPSGHNWAYYWDRTGANSGWYFIGPKGGAFHYADTVPDNYSLYAARDFHDLFKVDV